MERMKKWKVAVNQGYRYFPAEAGVLFTNSSFFVCPIDTGKELFTSATWGTHLRRDTVIPQWFQASKAAGLHWRVFRAFLSNDSRIPAVPR